MKVPRLYAIHCTGCKCNMLYSTVDMPQPPDALCHSCASSYARVCDMMRNDGKEHAIIELRRLKTDVLAPKVANQIAGGVQLAITLRKKSRNAKISDKLDINVINNLTIS